MTNRNKTAERLRQAIFDLPDSVPAYQRDQLNVYLSGALHEQVERLRERLAAHNPPELKGTPLLTIVSWDEVTAIFDEEAVT